MNAKKIFSKFAANEMTFDILLKKYYRENQCINSKRLDSCQESSEKYFAGRLSLRSLTFRREIFGGSESRGTFHPYCYW